MILSIFVTLKRHLRHFRHLVFSIAILFQSLALAPSVHSAPVPKSGWAFEVLAEGLERVDNVLVGPSGELFITLEMGEQGRVLLFQDGVVKDLGFRLHRPDGLALHSPFLFITEEVDQGRVTRFDLRDQTAQVLARLEGPEGIEVLPNGDLLITEDHGGRLVSITQTGEMKVWIEGLQQPEGLAVSSEGSVYIAETHAGRILKIQDQKVLVFADHLDHPDQIEIAPDGSIWVTEDATPGRLIRITENGNATGQKTLEIVMSGLMSPQGIAFGNRGHVYVAEQKLGRILELRPE